MKEYDPCQKTTKIVDIKKGRRAALKKIALGTGLAVGVAGLPRKWTQPVIDMVILPAHAQTSTTPPTCECQIADLEVNSVANTFSATYSWSNCPNIDQTHLVIAGPGVENILGYIQPFANPSGSRTDLIDTPPYNATIFQQGETYVFTLTLEDENDVVFHTCIETIVAI